MSARELVVLGTASQVPTRTRNHNGYLLRWDDETILFDPGEGTQRQITYAGASAAAITRICITHAHGDHCLGLPGILSRLALDAVSRTVDLHYPAAAQRSIDALRMSSTSRPGTPLREVPGDDERARTEEVLLAETSRWRLTARALQHRVPTLGYRLQESDGVRMLPERLAEHGIAGPDVGRLVREEVLRTDRGVVRVADVSELRRGQVFAFVMDTAWCDAALALAAGADLLVCESTFLHRDAELAVAYRHLTARQAAELAGTSGARRLVLTHFSQRYGDDLTPFLDEASAVFPDVVVAHDLDRIPVPRRA